MNLTQYVPQNMVNVKYLLVIGCWFPFLANAQLNPAVPMVRDADSIPSFLLADAMITVRDEAFQKRYIEAKFYVLRVYEYGMIASSMLQGFDDTLAQLDSKKEHRKFIKKANKYLKDEFGEEISNMSIKRGKYLMKIIHKETGMRAFDVIKDYRSGIKAVWWQSVMKIAGTSLKYQYAPQGEDDAMALVLHQIEQGKLKPYPRKTKTDFAKKTLSKKQKNKKDKDEKARKKEMKSKNK